MNRRQRKQEQELNRIEGLLWQLIRVSSTNVDFQSREWISSNFDKLVDRWLETVTS